MPGSASFPSGHSASSFAFATAVGDYLPPLVLPLRFLAGAVAYSLVHIGVPSILPTLWWARWSALRSATSSPGWAGVGWESAVRLHLARSPKASARDRSSAATRLRSPLGTGQVRGAEV
jgi:undecaprenyl-diphosphatase